MESGNRHTSHRGSAPWRRRPAARRYRACCRCCRAPARWWAGAHRSAHPPGAARTAAFAQQRPVTDQVSVAEPFGILPCQVAVADLLADQRHLHGKAQVFGQVVGQTQQQALLVGLALAQRGVALTFRAMEIVGPCAKAVLEGFFGAEQADRVVATFAGRACECWPMHKRNGEAGRIGRAPDWERIGNLPGPLSTVVE